MKFLSSLDFLGTIPKLTIAGSNSHKTLFGGLLSIFIAIILLSGSSYFMYLMVSRTNYSVVSSEEYFPNSFVNWTNYEVSFYMSDKLGEFLPDADRLYTILGFYLSNKKVLGSDGKMKVQTTMTPLRLEKCNTTRHFSQNEELWKQEKFIEDSYCLAPNQMINVSKPLGSDNNSFVNFIVVRCRNTTTKNDCYPRDYIDKTLSNNFILSRFINYYFDHSNIYNPAVPYVNSNIFPFSTTINKRIWYTQKSVQYDTDYGIFFPSLTTQNYSILADWRESYDLTTETVIPGAIGALYFNMYSLKTIYTKRYYKFQNMIADLGGLLKGLITIATLINYYFCIDQFYNRIINENINSLTEKADGKGSFTNIKKNDVYEKYLTEKYIELRKRNPSYEKSPAVTKILEPAPDGFDSTPIGSTVNKLPSPRKDVPESGNAENIEKFDMDDPDNSPRKDNKFYMVSSVVDKSMITVRSNISSNKSLIDRSFKKNIISLGCSEYILPLCCFSENSIRYKKLKIHLKYKDLIKKQFDILSIIPRLYAVDKISYLLSGQNYLYGIKNIVSPSIYNDGKIPENSELNQFRDLIIKDMIPYKKNH